MKKIFEDWREHTKEEDPLKVWQNALLSALGETGEEAPIVEAHGEVDIMPFKDENKSGFCIYNPQINDYAAKSPETFAETLLFVFGTMQTPWPKFAPYFRFIMDMVKNGEDVGTFVAKETPDEYKRALVRKTYLNANGMDESSLTEEQELYLEKAISSLIMMASTPKSSYYNLIWENRESFYGTIMPLIAKQEGGAGDLDSNELLELYVALLKIPGLQKAKAGFAMQVLTGKLGCVDSIWSKIWKATDPTISAMITQTLKGQAKGSEANIQKHAQTYIDLLKAIKEGSGMGSKELWDAWTEQVALQMRNPGRHTFDYTLRDREGNVVLSADNETSIEHYTDKKGLPKVRDVHTLKYNYQAPRTKEGKPSQTYPHYASYPGKVDELPDTDELTLDVSKQHHPKKLKYVAEDLNRVIAEVLRSRAKKKINERLDGPEPSKPIENTSVYPVLTQTDFAEMYKKMRIDPNRFLTRDQRTQMQLLINLFTSLESAPEEEPDWYDQRTPNYEDGEKLPAKHALNSIYEVSGRSKDFLFTNKQEALSFFNNMSSDDPHSKKYTGADAYASTERKGRRGPTVRER